MVPCHGPYTKRAEPWLRNREPNRTEQWDWCIVTPLLMEHKNVFCGIWEFEKLVFPLGEFSIRNFTLRNLKGNGNAATDLIQNNPSIIACRVTLCFCLNVFH